MDLLAHFKDSIKKNNLFSPKDKLMLAVSGGVDSVVLCELCKQAGYKFSIAHCNFKLRGEESDSDELFVKELANKYEVEFFAKTFDTKAISHQEKKSIEETARDLRYAWFYELINQSTNSQINYILTGHHADDNIETVVMNFFRGTGIKGLRGILPKKNKIIRPLLFARRKDIEDFAFLHQLKYVTDHTNLETAFTRNFFRNNILPEVMKFYPGVDKNIINNIERFGEIEELYKQAINLHKSKLLEAKGNEFLIPVLKLKKSAPLKSIVFEIIKDFGFTAHQTDEVIALLDSETGKYISSETHCIIKNRNWIIISSAKTEDATNILIEDREKAVQFSLGTLKLETTTNYKLQTTNFSVSLDAKEVKFPLLLRKAKSSDYFYPLGMKKKKKLNRFFIDQKLSKTEKENVWVLESNQRIIWVVGHRIDDRFKLTDRTKEVLQLKLILAQ